MIYYRIDYDCSKHLISFKKSDFSDNQSCFEPGIFLKVDQVENDNETAFDFKTGYLSSNYDFIPCPHLMGYVEFEQLKFAPSHSTKCHLIATIYEHEFSIKRNLDIRVPMYWFSDYDFDFTPLEKILYRLNTFLAKEGKCDSVSSDLNTTYNEIEIFNRLGLESTFRSFLNRLKIDVFYNNLYRVGKDNFYWKEVEIQLTKTDSYFLKIFERILASWKRFNKIISFSDEILIIQIDFDPNGASCSGRQSYSIDELREFRLELFMYCSFAVKGFFIEEDYLNSKLMGS
ncbi:MAG: hypothetical protein KDC92_00860 [Bacteroidetes bacterium]|nr:hypothetical protein [Bacteroidota bacterium]